MKNKTSETILYSAVGVVAMFLVLVAANFLLGRAKQRIDLTQERAYTLSGGTRAILKKLDTPVQIRLYVTQGEICDVLREVFGTYTPDSLTTGV